MPWGCQQFDYFEGIHLACLTGHNGAGKSSLLDAMTWVLWGKARGRRVDDLVHLDLLIKLLDSYSPKLNCSLIEI